MLLRVRCDWHQANLQQLPSDDETNDTITIKLQAPPKQQLAKFRHQLSRKANAKIDRDTVIVFIFHLNIMVIDTDTLCCDNVGHDASSEGSITSPTDDGILECDYDMQCTKLYKSIEEKKWEEVLYYLETGKWHDTSIFTSFLGTEPEAPSVSTRTWVTALDSTGNVRWCQLPLHAAVTFRAPFSVIASLIEVFPKSVRCADDQDMLPLHYAFRFGAEDDVLAYLMEKFPQAIGKKAVKGRLPLDMAYYGPKPERGVVIEYYVETAIQGAKAEWDGEYEKIVTAMKTEADAALVNELTGKRKKLREAQRELALAMKEIERLKEELITTGMNGSLNDADISIAHNRSLRSSRTIMQTDSQSATVTSKKKKSVNADISVNSQRTNRKSPRSSRGAKTDEGIKPSHEDDDAGKLKGFGQFFGKKRK